MAGSSAVNKNQGKLPLAETLGHSRVSECIQAKHGNRFVMDGPGRKFVKPEKKAD
jgi:hypothetical protein